jgi:hypothetical protein
MAIETATASAIVTNSGDNPRQFQDLFTCIPFTFTFDEDSIGSGASSAGDVTVTGAELGDFVLVAATIDLVDVHVQGFVQSANTVTITATELGLGANTVLAGNPTFNGLVLKPRAPWATRD